ncbi:AraC family transcriptional regulator with amidase-like domain [Haloactinopolyspora alba]|uniref:AraC family transcriptional regulator with amidase-like domain n=1 Tax=Haloactinopolyspora alba TaxID=648780 RepID=A0A2P8E7L0_9ACTN|nr:helix-turn-helix domain-containing protein [Haloactinopolyspora alba]PSL05437.1 AraC family transcriptional regulator with amidase-like domain [Haloactinopolyspora alba]
MQTSRHRVSVLALPGVLALDLGIPVQTFGSDPNYDVTVCADPAAGPIRCGGFEVTASAGLEALDEADTVVVPGYAPADATVPGNVLRALRAVHTRGARIVSICTGAFALAAAGLLDGRPATTHWQDTDRLQRLYPRISVAPNRLFVDDADILTSAGVTAGVDLCLHIIRHDHGTAAANTRARALVAPPQRTGGQAQFVEQLRPAAVGTELAAVRDWMLANLAHHHTLDTLAQRAHISRRTFTRRFRDETGTSPLTWLTSARIDRARELLEETNVPIERIGDLSGIGSPAALRAAFRQHLGTSPRQYRALFRHKTDTVDISNSAS